MISEKNINDIARIYGTPMYIFDVDVFSERAAMVSQAFGPQTGCCYSIKANPFLVPHLPEVFDHLEVCSPGELTICEMSGADMRKVIYSGVNKGPADILRAIGDGVGILTAESLRHVEMIEQAAGELEQQVPVLLRLTGGSQFGMDAEVFKDIVRRREEYPHIRIEGIHYFTGTQKKKVSAIEKELHFLDDFIEEVKKNCEFKLEKVEYGTGLFVDYFGQDAETSARELLEGAAAAVRWMSERHQLTIEMGRFFAASCGCHVTEVVDVKTNNGYTYAICDSGMNQLKYDGQLKGMQTPRIRLINRMPSPEKERVIVCGSLCTTADVLVNNLCMGPLYPGDLLAFYDTGAYSVSEGMAAFLSRELPAVMVYSAEKGIEPVRGHVQTCLLNMAGHMEG